MILKFQKVEIPLKTQKTQQQVVTNVLKTYIFPILSAFNSQKMNERMRNEKAGNFVLAPTTLDWTVPTPHFCVALDFKDFHHDHCAKAKWNIRIGHCEARNKCWFYSVVCSGELKQENHQNLRIFKSRIICSCVRSLILTTNACSIAGTFIHQHHEAMVCSSVAMAWSNLPMHVSCADHLI